MAIGTSAYKMILDATQLAQGAALSRRELSFLKQTLRDTASETEIMGAAVDRLGDLHRKGALTADQYERAIAQEKLLRSKDAEIERLRSALESIADLPPGYADMRQDDLVVILANKARAAITQENTND